MKLNLNEFEGVAFDFDGTLAVSHPAHNRARDLAFGEHGVVVTDEIMAVGHRHGNNPTTIVAGILKAAGHIAADADPYTNELVTKVVATKNQRYAEITQEGLELQLGVLPLLQAVVSHYGPEKVAVVTTAPLTDVMPTLRRNNIDHYFSPTRLITSDMAKQHSLELKPAADQYEYAATVLGITAAKMLVVEDTTGGVIAGHGAGAPVLAVGTTSPREIFFAGNESDYPDYFADAFTDVVLGRK